MRCCSLSGSCTCLFTKLLSSFLALCPSSGIFVDGTTQWTVHWIVLGQLRLLCHLDLKSSPNTCRCNVALCLSAVQCMSSWSLASDICTDNKPARTHLLREFAGFICSGSRSSFILSLAGEKWWVCLCGIKACDHESMMWSIQKGVKLSVPHQSHIKHSQLSHGNIRHKCGLAR